MRLSHVVLTSGTLFVFAVSGAYAQTTSTPVNHTPAQQGHSGGGQHHGNDEWKHHSSCKHILEACHKAGFIVGQWKKDNGEYKDCFDPILDGKPVTQDGKDIHVSVNPGDVKSCRAARHGGGEGGGHHHAKDGSSSGGHSSPAQSR